MKHSTFFLLLALLPLMAVSQENVANLTFSPNEKINYPVTKTVDSSDVFYGIKIPDPYRWLEQNDTASVVKNWIAAQNKITDNYFSQIPFRKKLKKEISSFINYPKMSAPFRAGDHYYFTKNSGLQNQDVWYQTKDPSDLSSAKVFLDPNTFYNNGAYTFQSINFTTDGSLCAYTLSPGGSDWRIAIVKNTQTGEILGDTVKNVFSTGIAWRGDDGFYYSSYKIPKGESRLLYSHNIAANTNNNQLYIRDLTRKNAPIIPVVTDYKSIQYPVDNDNSTLYIYTNRNAPHYRLVKVDASHPVPENWKDVIPENKYVLNVTTGGGDFFATYIEDVKDKVFQYDHNGNKIREIKLPAAGTVYGLSSGLNGLSAQKKDTGLYFTFTSFIYPNSIYHYNIKSGKTSLYWKPNLDFNPGDYVTKQVFYHSKDGTNIPMYIVYKKGLTLNGKNPVFLTGYGGFGVSLMPSFIGALTVWLNHGGIFARPNLRGGGEYGKKWHMAGVKMHKQNVFDDFIASAEYLIKKKYTSPDYLAIAGASNGGLLVGATMTQRPDLMKVAMPTAGVLDMLRYNKFTAGAGWAYDYGTAEDSLAMFKYLLSYSPLQNVKKAVHYPATLVWTADHDDRVVPAHSFKFAATLQADNAGNNPVLLRVQHDIGHGTGMVLSQQIDYLTNQLAFAWYNMGVNPFKCDIMK